MKLDGIEIWQPGFVLGAKWDRSSNSPALTRIDVDGNTMSTLPYSLNQHPLWGGMRRCTMTAEGLAAYGTNARGDGLTLDGSTGRVMVEIPKFYMKVEHPSANVWEWYLSPASLPGYEIHPAFVQSHDANLKGIIKDNIYVGAYEAVLANDAFPAHTGTVSTFHSYTGQQPWTGYGGATRSDGMTELPYDTGSTEFTIGETLTGGLSGAVGTVVDWVVIGGDWATNDAFGGVGLKQQTAVDYQAEGLTGSSGGAANAIGVQTNMTLNMADCRTYTETNLGGRWGFMNVWTLAAIQMLYIVEYANFYSQSTTYGIGQGIVNKPGGTGFAGEETGYDSADSNIGTNGTGVGTGTDGLTPIVYRGIENLWGNTGAYTDGYNAVDASYNIVKADGTGTFADTLLAGNYDASSMAPTNADGYVTKIEHDDLMKYFMISTGAGGGSSSTYVTDHFYAHDAGETNILFAGGGWFGGAWAGVACSFSRRVATDSYCFIGSRLEFM